MFLKKLYRHNKTLCLVVVAFLFAYIYLNYKWGMVATPIHQYGMFSGKHYFKDPLKVYFVKANGKNINEATISQIERDVLQTYPDYYEKQKSVNESVYNTVSAFFKYAAISAEKNRYKYLNTINDSLFTTWYQTKIREIIHEPLKYLEVTRQQFVWENGKLKPIDTAKKLSFIVPD